MADRTGKAVQPGTCRTESLTKQVLLSLDLSVDSELAAITECGREFQAAEVVQRNARLENSDSSKTVDEQRVRPQSHAVM